MKRLTHLAGLLPALALLCVAPVAPAADVYTIDPTHCSIVFSVGHSGFSFTYGMFRTAEGKYLIDEANPANCRFQLTIKANSLDTNNQKRDDHLRSPDFFNVQQYPEITFDSTKCVRIDTPDSGGVPVYQVTGDLTIHGVKKQFTIPALRMLGKGTGPYGDQRSGFLCQVELKRSDFGMTGLLDKNNLVGDAVGVTVSFEGTLDQPAAARTGTTRPQ
jgi:polyisoprenoid-binding protein YceI